MRGGFFKVLSVEEFASRCLEFPRPPAEDASLAQADGRFLAADVISPEDLPAADRSCMDGYAVRARDTFGASESNPAYLECVAELAIDEITDLELAPGQCAAVVTGGRLPAGADGVVMVEHTGDLGAGSIEVRKAVAPHDNVMLRGEDARAGQPALAAGTAVRPQEIGLLAALGISTVLVGARPRVGILSTGDELVAVEAAPQPGQVRDVNSLALAALASRAGAEPVPLGIARDVQPELEATLAEALEGCDAVFISGGSSVGTRDLTVAAIQALDNAEVLAHGVAISPGKPTILARVGVKAVWGLPGQVASAQVVMHVLGAPFLRHLMGQADPFDRRLRRTAHALLARNTPSRQGREDYVRVRLERDGDGPALAVPVLGKSGLLRTMLGSDGLVCIPAQAEGLAQGAEVEVWLP